MKRKSEIRLFLGILAGVAFIAAIASIPPWLNERQVVAQAVQQIGDSRAVVVGPARHAKGPADAPFTLVEFGDFSCPNCARAAPYVTELLARHPRDLRYLFRHYPLEQHETARMAAWAAEAAGAQNRFWPMVDLMFHDSGEKEESQIPGYAQRLRLDMKRWMRDIESPAIAGYVDRDVDDANKLHVTITPTFFFITPSHIHRIIGTDFLKRFLNDASHWR